ncbi:zf-TFIIB domain-containing protein [Helicobacter pullorum]|uniref:TFIIB-type zinc ribbon-containing protein n=1 Tax=Helicobacter pullorum TaxID=35818 RepID=UPI00174C2FAC|nr:zf-TFIIB domain-containing protein [Helicobacter pullorum]
MQCPVCNVDLVMSERSGVEIDYCPKCRGVWLDRGELDKIIERSQSTSHFQARYEEPRYKESRHYEKPRKRESFLGELFDF